MTSAPAGFQVSTFLHVQARGAVKSNDLLSVARCQAARRQRAAARIRMSASDAQSDGQAALQSMIKLMEERAKKNRSDRGWAFMQMATVEEGVPRNRTVVYRGLFENLIMLCTHASSRKVRALQNSNVTEIAWWMSVPRDQFRIQGRVLLVGSEGHVVERTEKGVPAAILSNREMLRAQRAQLWSKLSMPAKAQFFWPGVPGEELHPDWPGEQSTRIMDAHGQDRTSDQKEAREGVAEPECPPAFLLVLVVPEQIDHLNLKTNMRTINGVRVNP
ncbi:Pyridoxine/pyridoxamine 5'-phosphate oxidase 2 [Porphyridium purpureum]|uniref:Pyridoxine/pyridoxamine 5'-phosphate oxidase 2 n=1 Tax=Porphyridium purpureum TaxID=35688 RepID=A0A5J4Z4N2_PORPP|nr:Pyridoxine/pyridoxamine 5'-phosphate oxidase 2 [Porphyridium purpureum]|eukprot:POR4331..scf295_1